MPPLPACNPVVHRGCSRAWLSDSTRLLPPHTCWSDLTEARRTPRRTDSATAAANAGTVPVYAPESDPGNGINGPSPLLQNPLPAARPWHFDRTTAGALETR